MDRAGAWGMACAGPRPPATTPQGSITARCTPKQAPNLSHPASERRAPSTGSTAALLWASSVLSAPAFTANAVCILDHCPPCASISDLLALLRPPSIVTLPPRTTDLWILLVSGAVPATPNQPSRLLFCHILLTTDLARHLQLSIDTSTPVIQQDTWVRSRKRTTVESCAIQRPVSNRATKRSFSDPIVNAAALPWLTYHPSLKLRRPPQHQLGPVPPLVSRHSSPPSRLPWCAIWII